MVEGLKIWVGKQYCGALLLSSLNYLITTVPKFAIIFQEKGTKGKEADQLTVLTGPASPVEGPMADAVGAPSLVKASPTGPAPAPVVEEAALSASIPLSSVTKVTNVMK